MAQAGRLPRKEPPQQVGEIVEQPRLELVDAYTAGRVWGVHAGDATPDAALPNRRADVVRDVRDVDAVTRARAPFLLMDFQGFVALPDRPAYSCRSNARNEGSRRLARRLARIPGRLRPTGGD